MLINVKNIDDLKMSGIYCILCLTNGKRYIGRAKTFKARFSRHKHLLKTKKHSNKLLQKDWGIYGYHNFEFSILEITLSDNTLLFEREQFWSDFYNTFNREFGYSLGKCAKTWNFGRKATEEERNKLSQIGKSRMTPEKLLFLRNINKGRKWGPEYCAKMKLNFLGKHHSDKSKEKLSIAQSKYQQSLSKEQKRSTFCDKMKTYVFVSPNGDVYQVIGMRGFCEEFGLDRAAILRIWREKKGNKSHKGWTKYKEDKLPEQFISRNYGKVTETVN